MCLIKEGTKISYYEVTSLLFLAGSLIFFFENKFRVLWVLKKKIWRTPLTDISPCAILQKRERERRRHTRGRRYTHIYKNNTNNNGTNAGEVKRSDLRHFLEQSRNHGLLRPRRLERDLEENRRRMVRRDRVRDRTDRGDRDVSYCFLSSFIVVFCCFRKGWCFGFSLSRPLFKRRTCDDEVNKDGKEKGERTRAIIV